MSTKISELPLYTDYALEDYIPIVDSAGLITNRIRMTTLVTGSFGLSASFISLVGAPVASQGAVRIPNLKTGLYARNYLDTGDYVLIGAYPGFNGVYIGQNGDATNQGDYAIINASQALYLNINTSPRVTLTAASLTVDPTIFAQGITASLGVSGSHGSFGTGYTATTGLVRLANNDGIYFRNAANGADIAALFVNSSNNVVVGNGANGGSVQVYAEGITIDSRAQATLIQTSDQIVFADRNSGQHKLKWLASNDTLTLANSGSTVTAFDSYLKGTDDKATELTTPGSPSKAIYMFISGANGKTYLVDTIVTAQSTTTTGSLAYKLTGHYYMVGGVIGVVDAPYTILESANHAYLTASLTSSAGNIIVSGTQGASAETFRWGCFTRVQEQGSA